MQIARHPTLLAVLLASAAPLWAQEGSSDAEARSRELSQRMRVTLEQQAKVLSRMQRELERASRSDPAVRDSIVRVTSQQIAELGRDIARVQMEADRAQLRAVAEGTRAQLRVQIASARAIADVARTLARQQRVMITRTLPRGYLGVTLSGEQNTELRDGKVFTMFLSPSVIESVEPGSPAANGGLEAGDTIIAFGRLPVPGAVPLADVMTPGERVPFKIHREGRERTMTVVIGTRQLYSFMNEWPTSPRSPQAPVAPMAPMTPAAPHAPLLSLRGVDGGSSWSPTDFSIAGAVMTTITDELEELTGADEGILVLRVAPGTPAASSGLRGGDVIIRVNDEECSGVRDLQVAVQRASSRGARRVLLVVSRKQKEQTLTLQW